MIKLVLILVVMDDVHDADMVSHIQMIVMSLNPCCNG